MAGRFRSRGDGDSDTLILHEMILRDCVINPFGVDQPVVRKPEAMALMESRSLDIKINRQALGGKTQADEEIPKA